MEIPIYSNIRENLELIETFMWDPEKGAPDIALHLERMCKSAANLKFKFEISEIQQKIIKIKSQRRLRCRLTLRFDGKIKLLHWQDFANGVIRQNMENVCFAFFQNERFRTRHRKEPRSARLHASTIRMSEFCKC